jgi:hypothetical protein
MRAIAADDKKDKSAEEHRKSLGYLLRGRGAVVFVDAPVVGGPSCLSAAVHRGVRSHYYDHSEECIFAEGL